MSEMQSTLEFCDPTLHVPGTTCYRCHQYIAGSEPIFTTPSPNLQPGIGQFVTIPYDTYCEVIAMLNWWKANK